MAISFEPWKPEWTAQSVVGQYFSKMQQSPFDSALLLYICTYPVDDFQMTRRCTNDTYHRLFNRSINWNPGQN